MSTLSWSAALLALAAALVLAPGPVHAVRRIRAWHPGDADDATEREPPGRALPVLLGLVVALSTAVVAGGVSGVVLGVVSGLGTAWVWPRWQAHRARPRPDPLQEAGAWDQLAACLRAGLPLDRSARAVVPALPPVAGAALTRVADLVALGADPVQAWAPALDEPTTVRLARAARRSARSGSAVAEIAETVAADVRAEEADAVAARAERAGVLVTGPLGLCFLPAFLALGIVPVVVGLAGPLLEQR